MRRTRDGRRHPTGQLRIDRGALLAWILALATLSACDESFSPIATSPLHLSIFGALNASADTQWVRLSPIRPLIVTSSDRLGATVTLEETSTGRVIELHDSVFHFSPPDSIVGSGGVYLNNYWTTEKIQPGATYRFTASLEGKPPSEAMVKVPADYRVELWIGPDRLAGGLPGPGDLVRLEGLRHVAFVVAITEYVDGCTSYTQRVHFRGGSPDTDVQLVPIFRPSVRSRVSGCGEPDIRSQRLLIVGSGAAWPSGPEYETGSLDVPSSPSNISYALGYLGGVLTHTIPYDNCRLERTGRQIDKTEPPPNAFCKLQYDSASVTLTGTVRDAHCGGHGIDDALIELRELDPDSLTKVRLTSSNSSGAYLIGALEAGMPYGVSVTRGTRFQPYADTVTFAPGEKVTYDVPLWRPRCDN